MRFKNWQVPYFDDDGWAYWPDSEYPYIERKYGWRCQNHEGLKLGKNVDVGCFSYLNGKYGIEIQEGVQIGSHVSIYSINTQNNTKGKVFIGNNSLIGSHSLILPNSNIPPNSKIRVGSIVDVDENGRTFVCSFEYIKKRYLD